MIYANVLIFGLSSGYCALLNLLSASFVVLPIFSKFHIAVFSNCLFSAFTDCDEKKIWRKCASEVAGNIQKAPACADLNPLTRSQVLGVL